MPIHVGNPLDIWGKHIMIKDYVKLTLKKVMQNRTPLVYEPNKKADM
jgi:hypothetical protein